MKNNCYNCKHCYCAARNPFRKTLYWCKRQNVQRKYFVAKTNDMRDTFNSLIDKEFKDYVRAFFAILNKKNNNTYLVVNQDEPYAQQVWKLIKQGERAKGEE